MNKNQLFSSVKGTATEFLKKAGNRRKMAIGLGLAVVVLVGGVAVGTAGRGEAEPQKAKLAEVPEAVDTWSILAAGNEIARLDSEEDAHGVLEQVKAAYLTEGTEVLEVSFAEEVVVTQSAIENGESPVLTSEEAITLILTGSKEPKTYVVQGGDTLWDIALANNLSPYELMEMNPGVEDKVSIGQTLNLYQVKPYVTVRTKEILVAEERVEYPVQYENTSNLYKGQSQVKAAGSYGAKSVRAEVVKENGQLVATTVLEETVLEQPVTQVTLVGTKTVPITTGTGQLGIPVTNVEISSAFGSRGGGRHLGVDLRMPKGSPVMAADSGTVTKAAYSGSYGNLIIINHGNGMQTYYSHCNTINVSVGQTVTKGDVIGTIGATGNATGYHLHFEVRINGVAQNPVNYF
jgi:murein DD-endopeptidase MepM/ murein hydrolase activator NlpD